MTQNTRSVGLWVEFATLFILIPLLLYAFATRWVIYLTLWGISLYALLMLIRASDFSWHNLWHGDGWPKPAQRFAFLRFAVIAILLALVTWVALPEKFMRFPLDRFPLWLAVMVLYPLLSIVPQELCFRSFYFKRYGGLIPNPAAFMFLNGLLFGFSHIILNNWVAPTCCSAAGILLAHSYQQHRSLKWAVIEHSLYGCWIFTVGIGWYFFTGNWRS